MGSSCFTSSHDMPSKTSHFMLLQGVPAPCPRMPCTWRCHQSPWHGMKVLAPAWHCHTQTALAQWLRKQLPTELMAFPSPSGFPCPLGWHCPPTRNWGTGTSPGSQTEALCLKAQLLTSHTQRDCGCQWHRDRHLYTECRRTKLFRDHWKKHQIWQLQK